RTLAEELVQETFMRAWRAFDQLRDERKAKSWLITTLRREYARQFERYRPEYDDLDVDHLEADRGDPNPDVWLVRRALGRISRKYREPLVLQVLGGYSANEIAHMLELSPEAVMTRLFRARQRLRQIIEEEQNPRYERVNAT
ncbi:MAG: sigma-70 family RNA polymerase sigma factor, partial [Gammaproteobacteria bacterium]|nr:sigma-70 family RNA polymerase sigma factor [Gammaproteobacteria bacterium]NIR82978.1 sigma-70 family RNA polymerase sigma factor [Gammaproteobacteria bacterium]NIR90052.1 sigma-70 family RNA polymerase sigma factor [Gammaproteobacteria bacterium]